MEAQLTLTEKDKLYFPHQWQKRYPDDEVLERHIHFFNTESQKVIRSIRCEFNIPYGFLDREKYDIFGIDLPDDSPILIHVHGGYWQVKEINNNNQAFLAKALHRHKIKVIAIDHELCPDVSVQDIIIEIQVALKRCLSYAKKCHCREIYLSGHSSGALMVAALFSNFITNLPYDEQALIKNVFLSCGLYDVTPLTDIIINQGLKLTDEIAMSVSPQYMNLTSPTHVAFYVIVPEYESPAFVEQAIKFNKKLSESKINTSLIELKGEDHFTAIERIVEDDFVSTRLIVDASK